MRKAKLLKLCIYMSAVALLLTACSDGKNAGTNNVESSQANDVKDDAIKVQASEIFKEVEITDFYGTVVVPVNPERVVVLDSRSFETLSDWGIELAAVPKAVMPADSPYVANEAVLDIGNHREPNLEIIAAIDPELVII